MQLDKKSSPEAEALGRSRGGFSTKIHIAVDALGNPLKLVLSQGQRSDFVFAETLVETFCPALLIADKGYDSRAFINQLQERDIEVVIPSCKNRKEQRAYDKNLYKDRNKVERFINRLKHYRRVATRYEKTARNFLAFLHLTSSMILLL